MKLNYYKGLRFYYAPNNLLWEIVEVSIAKLYCEVIEGGTSGYITGEVEKFDIDEFYSKDFKIIHSFNHYLNELERHISS